MSTVIVVLYSFNLSTRESAVNCNGRIILVSKEESTTTSLGIQEALVGMDLFSTGSNLDLSERIASGVYRKDILESRFFSFRRV